VADGDGLENHCGGNVTVGSNPTPSADQRERVRPLFEAADREGILELRGPAVVIGHPCGPAR
jgi:hypothetical protein